MFAPCKWNQCGQSNLFYTNHVNRNISCRGGIKTVHSATDMYVFLFSYSAIVSIWNVFLSRKWLQCLEACKTTDRWGYGTVAYLRGSQQTAGASQAGATTAGLDEGGMTFWVSIGPTWHIRSDREVFSDPCVYSHYVHAVLQVISC